jgi:hypothetical protein
MPSVPVPSMSARRTAVASLTGGVPWMTIGSLQALPCWLIQTLM